MKAMVLSKCAPIEERPLSYQEVPCPIPSRGEVLVRIHACGVCRTDLHLVEGELHNPTLPIIPGHQGVGEVVALGDGCQHLHEGDRVGIAWLRHTCQHCNFCKAGHENLCDASLYTGYQVSGAYAEYAVVPEDYAYRIPKSFSDVEATPLLCAGIIGYRAFKRACVPPQGRLGLFGFGSSAHVTAQVAQYYGCEIYVATRDVRHQDLARKMGAVWVGDADAPLPRPVDSVIIFAPAGELVPTALRSLRKGGTVALAGITMSDIPSMDYDSCLFHEKQLLSVESNTREDGHELLKLAETIPIKPHISVFGLQEANEVLLKLKNDAINGSAVLIVRESEGH